MVCCLGDPPERKISSLWAATKSNGEITRLSIYFRHRLTFIKVTIEVVHINVDIVQLQRFLWDGMGGTALWIWLSVKTVVVSMKRLDMVCACFVWLVIDFLFCRIPLGELADDLPLQDNVEEFAWWP